MSDKMSEQMKQKLITAHLVSAMETIASNFESGPLVMINELESRLDKIRKIYHDHQDSNPPASVSDGKSRWSIVNVQNEGIFELELNGRRVGEIDEDVVPGLRALIAKEKLLDEVMGRIKMRTPITNKDLIAEYEKVRK